MRILSLSQTSVNELPLASQLRPPDAAGSMTFRQASPLSSLAPNVGPRMLSAATARTNGNWPPNYAGVEQPRITQIARIKQFLYPRHSRCPRLILLVYNAGFMNCE
jgi:hypothetical protein